MNLEWLDLAVCPEDGRRLTLRSGQPYCEECERPYTTVGRVPVLLSSEDRALFDSTETVRAPNPTRLQQLRNNFVSAIYTRHNESTAVKTALAKVLAELDTSGFGLNIGSGGSSLHPRLVNLDLSLNEHVDVIGSALRLPFGDSSFTCLVSQEVFEHVTRPWNAADEAFRVLKPGGLFYIQVPFVIGYHSLPHDYWRFSGPGLRRLMEETGFEVVEEGPSVGAGTSAYRIGVEFAASLASAASDSLYGPAKAVAALSLSPLRLADRITCDFGKTSRIPAGFYAIVRKPA